MSATPREVVARALFRCETSLADFTWDTLPGDWRALLLGKADRILAALTADPDTISRLADELEPHLNWTDNDGTTQRAVARAALAAALTPAPPAAKAEPVTERRGLWGRP